mgnify:CR=1 FL=1
MTHCIIGAGFSGLPIAKRLLDLGEPFEILEKNSGIGGLWHTGVYDGAHIISSKKTTEFPDFPMPKSYPDFPSKAQMQRYFERYAQHFGITFHVRFNTEVVSVRPGPDFEKTPMWLVTTANGETKEYRTVTIANGHNWSPRIVNHEGDFEGEVIHSQSYQDASIFKDKSVLIVGYGNTGCDLAVDASRVGFSSDISMRSGNYFFPKMFMGIPIADLMANSSLKFDWLERMVSRIIVKLMVGDMEKYGLPKPNHRILDRHPIVNTELINGVRHGRITPRPDIARFEGNKAYFTDGSFGEYDLVVYCTGYRLDMPMLVDEDQVLNWKDGLPELFLRSMSPNYRGIFFPGIGQARTGGGPLYQAGGYVTARLLAQEARSQEAVKDQLAKNNRIMFARKYLKQPLVQKADMSSRGLGFYLPRIRAFNKIMDELGFPDAPKQKSIVIDDYESVGANKAT